MDPDDAEYKNGLIQEYDQRNSEMRGNMGYQGIQYGKEKKSSTTTRSMFVDRRDQLAQLWNEKGFRYLDQELLMCKMVDSYNSGSE